MSCHYILLDWISYSFRRSSDSEWLISWVTGQQTGENNSRGERDPPRRESEEFSSFQKHFGSAILTDDNWPYKWSSGMRLYPGTYTNRMSIMYLKKIELTSVKTLHPWRLYKRDLQSFPSHRAWDYVMFCFGTCILASVYYFSVQSRSSDLPQNFRSRNSLKLIRNISTDDGMGNSVLYWNTGWTYKIKNWLEGQRCWFRHLLTPLILLDLNGVGELPDDDVDGGRGRLPLRLPPPRVGRARREPLVVAVLGLPQIVTVSFTPFFPISWQSKLRNVPMF